MANFSAATYVTHATPTSTVITGLHQPAVGTVNWRETTVSQTPPSPPKTGQLFPRGGA